MARRRIPDELLSTAHLRSQARVAGDWAEADRLRDVIEAAGWRVADRGTDFSLTPAMPADVIDGERVLYGSSAAVPSRFEEPASGLATVVLIATDWPEEIARALAAMRATAPSETTIVIVADGPSAEQAAMLEQLEPPVDGTPSHEVIWTSERLGHAAATNIGLRRTAASVAIVLDPSLEATGDMVTPLVRALDDESVAIVGGWGTVTEDLRRFEEAPTGDADAIDGVLQAFRRDDVAARGPLDEGFRSRRDLDVWWSLALRDEGEDVPARRARVVAGLPIVRHERQLDPSLVDAERDRQDKRNRYRLIDRFGWRRDLIVPK